MQHAITMHTVDFVVEFTPEGDIDAYYIGGQDVTEVIRGITKDALRSTVSHNASKWAEEYSRDMADEEKSKNYRNCGSFGK